MKRSRRIGAAVLAVGLLAAGAAAVVSYRNRPPVIPEGLADEINRQIEAQAWQPSDKLEREAVTVWVEGVSDRQEVQAKLEAAAGLDPKNRYIGHFYQGGVAMFKLAPVADVETFARGITFGRVLAFDPKEKVLLVENGADPAPPPWQDGEYIRRRVLVTKVLDDQYTDIADLAKEFGRDKVVTLSISGTARKNGNGTMHHAALRPLFDTPDKGQFGTTLQNRDGGVWQSSVAPVGDVGRFAKAITFGKVTIVDAERRVVFVATDDRTKEDIASLQGVWKPAKIEGQNPGKVEGVRVAVKGDRLTLGGKTEKPLEFTFKLDAAKVPPTIDIDSPLGGLRGIYNLDGDALTVCYSELEPSEKGVRPKELSAPAGSQRYLWVLARARPLEEELKTLKGIWQTEQWGQDKAEGFQVQAGIGDRNEKMEGGVYCSLTFHIDKGKGPFSEVGFGTPVQVKEDREKGKRWFEIDDAYAKVHKLPAKLYYRTDGEQLLVTLDVGPYKGEYKLRKLKAKND